MCLGDLGHIREEIGELKEGQKVMQKELHDISLAVARIEKNGYH